MKTFLFGLFAFACLLLFVPDADGGCKGRGARRGGSCASAGGGDRQPVRAVLSRLFKHRR